MAFNEKGILTVISGFAGAGKGSIVNGLMEKHPDDYCLSISATTRKPREGEINGREYFFLSIDEFENKIRDNEFIEYARYVGNFYGTPKDYVLKMLRQDKNVILEIEVQGALNVKNAFPDALLLFVTPPDARILEERLIGRGTEEKDVVEKRMSRAYEEALLINNYDYFIVNDDLDLAINTTHNIIYDEKCKINRNNAFTEGLIQQLKKFKKE